jgi:hypothetical protein
MSVRSRVWLCLIVFLLGIGVAISVVVDRPPCGVVIWSGATGIGMYLAGLLAVRLKPVLATPLCCVVACGSLVVFQGGHAETGWSDEIQWMAMTLLFFLLPLLTFGGRIGNTTSGIHD